MCSGAGAWPLLAALAAGADGEARQELAAACAVRPAQALPLVRAFTAALGESSAVRLATALWSGAGLVVHPSWGRELPPGSLGSLSGDLSVDQHALDGWAEEHTAGLVRRMPVTLTSRTRLVLACALAIRTDWAESFREVPDPWWDGVSQQGGQGLVRETEDVAAVRAWDAESPVTTVDVHGADEVDVRLVLGAEHSSASAVLAAAFAGLAGEISARDGAELVDGREVSGWPGVEVRRERCVGRGDAPRLRLRTVGFDLDADHDLLQWPELFGLASAADAATGHFSGVTAEPLAVDQARQSCVARFSARGFEAAAVTAVGMVRAGGVPPRPQSRRILHVSFDRPFGYLVVHRRTGLVLVAGWVRQPAALRA